jgi:tRNA(Ser,Leu) C12 N-acetylase TAN1
MEHGARRLHDWNVVVTLHEEGYRPARRLLAGAGAIAPTGYHNVLVMKVEDPRAFLDWLRERVQEAPGLLNFVARVIPAQSVFDFRDAEELQARAREAVLALAPQLAGRSFHVRMHRRGLGRRLASHDEERRLGEAALEALEAVATPARVAFDDPDAIIAVETVDRRASVSLWTREDMQRCPFLRLD